MKTLLMILFGILAILIYVLSEMEYKLRIEKELVKSKICLVSLFFLSAVDFCIFIFCMIL